MWHMLLGLHANTQGPAPLLSRAAKQGSPLAPSSPRVAALLPQRRQQDVEDAALLAAHHQRSVGGHLHLRRRRDG